MIGPIRWLRNWLAYRRMSTAQRWASDWMAESTRLTRRVEREWRRWYRWKRLLDRSSEALVGDWGEWEELKRQHEHVMTAVANENQIYKEIMIPRLEADSAAALQRRQAEMAADAARAAAFGPLREE